MGLGLFTTYYYTTGGGDPDSTARLVRGLNQNRLPQQYRLGACSGGASVMKPFFFLTAAFAMVVFALANII